MGIYFSYIPNVMTIIHHSSGRIRYCGQIHLGANFEKQQCFFRQAHILELQIWGLRLVLKNCIVSSRLPLPTQANCFFMQRESQTPLQSRNSNPEIPQSFQSVDATLQQGGSSFFIFQWESGRGDTCVLRLSS